MKNRKINTYGTQCLKDILGDSLVTRSKIKYFVYDGKAHPLKVSVTDVNSSIQNFNQMETINLAIHILGLGSVGGQIYWMILPVTEVARLSHGKKPQHGGNVFEDYILNLEEINPSFYVKDSDIKTTLENIIENQKTDSNYKLLESRMRVEQLIKQQSRENYDAFLKDFVVKLP